MATDDDEPHGENVVSLAAFRRRRGRGNSMRMRRAGDAIEIVVVVDGKEAVFEFKETEKAELWGLSIRDMVLEIRRDQRRQVVRRAWQDLQAGRPSDLPFDADSTITRLNRYAAGGLARSLHEEHGVPVPLALAAARHLTGKMINARWQEQRSERLKLEEAARVMALYQRQERDRGHPAPAWLSSSTVKKD